METVAEEIEKRLTKELEAAHIDIVDFSDDNCNGAKLNLTVVSDKFKGLPLLKRHRLVNDCLKDLINEEKIHAITMKTWTMAQYESKK